MADSAGAVCEFDSLEDASLRGKHRRCARGWIPLFLNDATLAIISLPGLLTLLAVLILGSGMGVIVWSLTR